MQISTITGQIPFIGPKKRQQMEDRTYQEIADIQGVPIGTVRSHLSRAKQIMKKSLLRSTIHQPQTKKVVEIKHDVAKAGGH